MPDIPNDAGETIDKTLDPTVFARRFIYLQFLLLVAVQRRERRRDLLLVYDHEVTPSCQDKGLGSRSFHYRAVIMEPVGRIAVIP